MTVDGHGDKPDDRTGEPTTSFRYSAQVGESGAAPATRSGGEASKSPRPRGALLVVDRGPNAGSRFTLDRPVTSVGRHPRSDIFLDDATVSRQHAEFRWTNDELQVIDGGSLNGTYVNHEPVESAVLLDGDELQFGKFRLTLRTQTD